MAFPDELLADEEYVVELFGPHWSNFVFTKGWQFAVYAVVWVGVLNSGVVVKLNSSVVGIVLLVIGIGLVLGAIDQFVRWATTRYAVTNQRIIVRTGFVATHEKTVALEQILGIDISQGVLDRIVGNGHLRLNTSVHAGEGITVLHDVHRPREMQRRLRDLARNGTE